MKTNMPRIGLACALLACLFLASTASFAANVLYYKNKNTVQAKKIEWREADQVYRVLTMDDITLPVPKAQVDHLEIDKPADLDKAAQMLSAKPPQYDAAIPLLDGVVQNYKMLVWDIPARYLLVRAHAGKSDSKKLIAALRPLVESDSKNEIPAEIRRLYWGGLLQDKQTATLKTDLEDAIAVAPREVAAFAQIARGDYNRSESRKEDALLDYLRTVILFEQVKEAQPEALFKAAELLDEMRDPRAEDMKKRLVSNYPDSPFAKQLSGKM